MLKYFTAEKLLKKGCTFENSLFKPQSRIIKQKKRKMKAGICNLPVIAMRAQPSEKSEMVSQILYGETYDIYDTQSKWALIHTHFDAYEGWISINQLEQIPEPIENNNQTKREKILTSLTGKIITTDKNNLLISFGSSLQIDPLTGFNHDTIVEGEFHEVETFKRDHLISYAHKLLGVPYLWGGRSVFGMDCSGFSQIIFKASGYRLMRDASLQANQGITVNFIQEAEPGDLAFFDNEEGQIVHVGILSDNKTVIHASGCVRIDSIDHHGIFNEKLGKYTHHLRIIKRI